MNDALYIAATGMHMQQKSVDTISNNIANINTPGFKKGRVSFEDLVYRDLAGVANAVQGANPARLFQGSGVAMSAIMKSFTAGELKKTDNPVDLAIQGEGFLEVSSADGTTAYVRGGALSVDKDGYLTTVSGYTLKPAIQVGADARELTVRPDGRVMVRNASDSQMIEVGQLEIVRFADTSGLSALGGNLYRPSDRSGDPYRGRPGEDGLGTLSQGFVEASNVNLVEEMVDLMVAQRAYESSVKLIQAADEMLAMSNNLRR
jgi:flagellar basal-body rod protein FlgG